MLILLRMVVLSVSLLRLLGLSHHNRVVVVGLSNVGALRLLVCELDTSLDVGNVNLGHVVPVKLILHDLHSLLHLLDFLHQKFRLLIVSLLELDLKPDTVDFLHFLEGCLLIWAHKSPDLSALSHKFPHDYILTRKHLVDFLSLLLQEEEVSSES